MPTPVSRRTLIRAAAMSIATLGVSGWILHADAQPTPGSGDLGDYGNYLRKNDGPLAPGTSSVAATPAIEPSSWSPTQDNILGPFYRSGAPYRAKITPPLEPGTTLLIRGRVFALDKRAPLPSTVLDIWQATANGRYDNDDPKGAPRPDVFTNRARLVTDESGYYEFETIHPGRYKIGRNVWRPAHIHYMVLHPGYKQLVTQLYFKGDPENARDEFIKPSLIIDLATHKTRAGQYESGTFDIVLAPA